MKARSSGLPIGIALILNLALVLSTATSYAQVETGSVTGQWGVWSGWFWPFNDTEPSRSGAQPAELGRALSRLGRRQRLGDDADQQPGLWRRHFPRPGHRRADDRGLLQ